MIFNDPTTQQTFLWLSALVVITLLFCACWVCLRFASALEASHQSKSAVQREISVAAGSHAREAEAKAKEAEMAYQLALLGRVGEIAPISVTVPQAQLDKLALDYARRRIESIKVVVSL